MSKEICLTAVSSQVGGLSGFELDNTTYERCRQGRPAVLGQNRIPASTLWSGSDTSPQPNSVATSSDNGGSQKQEWLTGGRCRPIRIIPPAKIGPET